jgi:hypothetical protein
VGRVHWFHVAGDDLLVDRAEDAQALPKLEQVVVRHPEPHEYADPHRRGEEKP